MATRLKISKREHRFLSSLLDYDWTKGTPAGVGAKTVKKCMDLGWVDGRQEFGKGPIRGFKLTPQGDAVLQAAGPYIH